MLAAEDDPDLLTLLELHLSREGFEVFTAADGQAAINQLDLARPDIIVTDLEMPTMDGLQLIRHLRADERWRAVPVLLFTAFIATDPRLLVAASLSHVTVHTKGGNVRALGGLLRSLIERARELDDVDAAADRERRRALETALALIADPSRLLPGEVAETSSADLAAQWLATYEDLLRFKRDIIQTTRDHHTQVGASGRSEVDLDLMVLEAQRARLAERAAFWAQRRRALEQHHD